MQGINNNGIIKNGITQNQKHFNTVSVMNTLSTGQNKILFTLGGLSNDILRLLTTWYDAVKNWVVAVRKKYESSKKEKLLNIDFDLNLEGK